MSDKELKISIDVQEPVKGKDYFTQEDQEAIVSEVLALIPRPEDGKDGKDAVVDYGRLETFVREEVAKIEMPEAKEPVPVDIQSIVSSVLALIPEQEEIVVDYPGIKQYCLDEIAKINEEQAGRYRLLNSGGPTTRLGDLVDVDVSSIVAGQVLSWDGTQWIPGSGGGDSQNLQQVTDVGSTTTNNIDALSFNSVALTATGSSTKFLAEDGTYVPVPTSGTLTYVLSSANSDIGGYESMPSLTDYTAGALASIVTAGVSTTPTLLGTFATDVGFPNVTVIPAGLFAAHWETEKTAGSNNYYCYYEVYKRTAGGTETLLSTSDITTQTAVNTVVQQTATALLTSNTTLLSTDRMVIKIYGVMLSATATITLYYDDTTDARFEMPSATVDATNFVPYTGATNDLNMGTKTITASSLITTGGTQTQFVTGDGQLRHIPIYTFFV